MRIVNLLTTKTARLYKCQESGLISFTSQVIAFGYSNFCYYGDKGRLKVSK